MNAVLFALALAQNPRCGQDATALITAASERAAAFDMPAATQQLGAAVTSGCQGALVPSIYLRGWIAARDAYRAGGSPESLKDVDAAIAELNQRGEPLYSYVLQAAKAAAQSERESLSLFIDQAVQLESVRLAAGLSPASVISAHEAAGDLWLQVHRYDEARRAYQRAAERVGTTPRITLGLARAAARLKDFPEACRQYRALVQSWKASTPQRPLEIGEAIQFPETTRCPGQ